MNKMFLQEELMDHFKFPRNKQPVEKPDFSAGERNPSCGDQVQIEGRVKNNTICPLGFSGKGCILSQAATSMLTEKCSGKSLDYIISLSRNDILELVGISLGPNRTRCALLCLEVLHLGVGRYKKNK